MKNIRKTAIMFAVIVTLLWGTVAVFAQGATDGAVTKDGIETQLLLDKDEYGKDEAVAISARIRNNSSFDVNDVKAELKLPGGFEIKGETTVERTVLHAEDSTGLSCQLSKSANPFCGNWFSILMHFILLCISAVLSFLLSWSKIIRTKSIAFLLCCSMNLPMLGQTGQQISELFDHSYTVSKSFTMDKNIYEVKLKVSYKLLSQNGPHLQSITPSTGSFGTKIILSGTGFADTTNVVFKSDALGEVSVTPVRDEQGNLCVVSPTIYVETVQVYAVCDDKNSNVLDFEAVALPAADGNEFEEFSEAFNSVFGEFGNELENVYRTADTADNLQEQQEMITALKTAMDDDVAYYNSLLTDEDKAIVNQMFATEALKEAGDKLKQAAEVLSHSTTSEALDNIEKTKEMIDELIGALKEIKDIINKIKIAAAAVAIALAVVSVFTGGATADAAVQAARITNNCRKLINNLLNPAIIGLSAVRSLLELAPTVAVGDSMTTADYEGDISINQYFGSLESGIKNPIKSLASYTSTFGTLPDSAWQATQILDDVDTLIDEFAGTDSFSGEEEITQKFNAKFNQFIWGETLETLSENGVPSSNTQQLPENPISLSLQDYIKTYFPETYLTCIEKDKERHEFEAGNNLTFNGLFGTTVRLVETAENESPYTAAGDTRNANEYTFYWSFESVLFATKYWPFIADSLTSGQSEALIKDITFSAIDYVKQISDSLDVLRKFWNSADYDIGSFVEGSSERILLTQEQNTALNRLSGVNTALEALKDKTIDEKVSGFLDAYNTAAGVQDEVTQMIATITRPFNILNLIQNVANLKTIDKFLETGFADIKPDDTNGRKLMEISSIINSGYDEMADLKTLFSMTHEDFNEFLNYISPMTENELKSMIQRGEKADEPLAAYVGEPYSFKAHMDYTTPENANIDFILDNIWDELADIAVSEISDYLPEELDIASNLMSYLTDKVVSKVLRLVIDETIGDWSRDALKKYICLTDVYVGVVLDSDNEEVIPDSHGDRVTLRPLKPGTATVRIYPSGITDPEVLKVCTIERQVNVVSGDNTSAPFDKGAKVTNVLDENGSTTNAVYIGSNVNFIGQGFSLYPTDLSKQRLFYSIPSTGFTPFKIWMVGESDYNNVRFEVPDSMPGKIGVEVKGSQANSWWKSNSLLDVLAPSLSTKLSSAFAGEGLTINGNGFSHTPQNNKVILDNTSIPIRDLPGGFAVPNILEDVTVDKYNHGGYTTGGQGEENSGISIEEGYGRLHKNLNIIVPQDTARSENSSMKVSLFDNQLNSNTNTVAVKKFYEKTTLTQTGFDARRPELAVNPATGDAVMIWARTGNNSAPTLFSTKVSKDGGTLIGENKISEDVGGIDTAPISPKIVFGNETYYCVWSNKDCDIVFAYSTDGASWSTPQKIEITSAIDKNISAAAADADGDGDEDLLITYTAQGLTETDSSSVRMAYVNTVTMSSYFVTFAKSIGSGDNDYSNITAKDGHIAVALATNNKQTHTGNLYYYCGRIGDYVTGNNISWQPVINNSDSPYTYAEHPDLAMTVSGAAANVYITWENVETTGTEDVYFASYTNNVKVIQPKNLSDSSKQSQTPQIFVDGNGVLGIVWIETGYGSQNNTAQTGFKSDVYMTRSFDMGENFNKPFMKLASATDGERIALPTLAAYGNANILIAWQRGNIHQEIGLGGQDQAYKIDLITSDRILSDTGFAYTGDTIKSSNEYLVRTYSPETPDSLGDMLYPENVNNGDLYLSKLDGSCLMQLTRRDQAAGITEASPNGRGLVYGLGHSVIVSEADGANPIVIYRTTAMNVAGGKWFETYPHRAEIRGSNKKLHVLLTGDKTDGKASEMLMTLRYDGSILPETDAESYYSTGFKWRDMVQSGFNTGQSGTTYYNNLIRWQTSDFGMYVSNKATFVEYSDYSPYDSEFKEAYSYTKGGNIKVVTREYGDTYAIHPPKKAASNGIMPAILPNDNRLLYISKSDDSVQYIDDTTVNQPVSKKISSDGASYAYPQFSSSAEWVLAQEMKPGIGMRIAVISPETGEKYLIGPASGVSGYASTFRTGQNKITETLNYSSITENGNSVPLTVRLAEPQSQSITVKVRGTDPRIVITPSQITLNAGETSAGFTIAAADDMLKQGDALTSIIISTAGGSHSYNGASVGRVLTIIDEDSLDFTAPAWPEGTKAGVQIRPKNVLDYTINWTAADDGGRPIKEYIIKQGEEEIGRTSALGYDYTMPADLDIAHLQVYGVDCGDNLTGPLAIDIDSSDQMNPYVESIEVTKIGTDFAEITLSARDNIQVGMVKVFNGEEQIFETLKTVGTKSETLVINSLSLNTQYSFEVVVYDTNSTPSSRTVSFKTKCGYTNVAFETNTAMLNEGSTQTVTLIRTGDLDENTEVPLIFEDITATRYVDYSFDAGSINFQPGVARVDLTLIATAPYDDNTAEQSESFIIKFGTMENGTPAGENTECTVSITDNELPVNKVEMANSEYTVSEDGGYVDVLVRHISNTAGGGFSVGYKFSNGTATNGTDYTGTAGTLDFASGETEKTIRIPILNDGVYESDFETFTVYLKGITSTNGVELGSQISSTIRINEVTSSIPIPVLTVVDDNTQWPSITVSNILGGGRLKVYRYNETTGEYENVPTLYVGSYPHTTDTWAIPINVTGRYVVTRIDAQERESNYSQSVYVTVKSNQIVRPPALTASIDVAPGTNSGTIKLTISGMKTGKVYYYGAGYNSMQNILVENEVFGSHSMDFPFEITAGTAAVIDNIPAEVGKFLNIAELDQGQASVIYGYTITACTSIYLDDGMVTE